jgi:hypothetical protein
MRGNSIRLRLKKSEVEEFGANGCVEETIEFGAEENECFVYALASSENIETVRAAFENNRMTIFLPKAQAEEWTRTNQVGIGAEQIISGNKTLQILIEKDFACLEERPGEDDADTFPHPLAGKVDC